MKNCPIHEKITQRTKKLPNVGPIFSLEERSTFFINEEPSKAGPNQQRKFTSPAKPVAAKRPSFTSYLEEEDLPDEPVQLRNDRKVPTH